MVQIHTIEISPPLINASCAWASDLAQLRELYDCPYTGAVTTRTATLNGFAEDDSNTVVFAASSTSSLNSYGYSPHPLASYLSWVHTLLTTPTASGSTPSKPIIISITAASSTVLGEMLDEIQELRVRLKQIHHSNGAAGVIDPSTLVAVELNTSCPNIKGTSPPAYNFPLLLPLLDVLASTFRSDSSLTIGLKLPPYLYSTRFQEVVRDLSMYSRGVPGSEGQDTVNPFAFITSTNTLGSSLFFADQTAPTSSDNAPYALPTQLGGLGGEALHPLALGNVFSFAKLLGAHSDPAMRRVVIVGVGGVTSSEAVRRMYGAGAKIVGCATMLGLMGVKVFRYLTDDASDGASSV